LTRRHIAAVTATQAVRGGEDLAAVPLPDGVSDYQRQLMMRVITASPVPPRSIARRRAVEPGEGEAEAKIETLADEALEAMGQADRWLATRIRPRS
jgi:hypothetical protein